MINDDIQCSVDLPEIKGNHRKFRTLVTSYIGTVGCDLHLGRGRFRKPKKKFFFSFFFHKTGLTLC